MLILLLLPTTGFAALLYFTVSYYRNVSRHPKGPFPLPFIGNLKEFNFLRQHDSLEMWARDWKGVYTVFIPTPSVVLNTYEAMREAFVEKGDDFAGRPTMEILKAFMYAYNSGVIMSNGDVWREQRRTALSILRDFGMGKSTMEENVKSSIQQFLDHVETFEDKERVELHWQIQVVIANIINEVLFDFRYVYSDCQPLMEYVDNLAKMTAGMANAPLFVLVGSVPILKKVPFLADFAMGEHQRAMEKLRQFIDDQVERSLRNFHPDLDEPQCFTQAYMQRALTNDDLSLHQLRAICFDFFLAGQETTTTTMRWTTLILAAHQDVQDKVRAEVLEVVGRDRLPSMQDKTKMPYAQACLHELQRFANILTVNVAHETVNDTEVQGHFIKKGTTVINDLHGILKNDPVFGGDGDKFRPERYLAEDGKTLKKELIERTVAFSIGKRACAGEGLARMELFLGLTSIVQKYQLLPSPDGPVDLSENCMIEVVMPVEQNLTLLHVD